MFTALLLSILLFYQILLFHVYLRKNVNNFFTLKKVPLQILKQIFFVILRIFYLDLLTLNFMKFQKLRSLIKRKQKARSP